MAYIRAAAPCDTSHKIHVFPRKGAKMQKPTVTASRPIHSGRVLKVSIERLRYANGREYDIDFVRHPGAAAVVAVDEQLRVCLVRQYRHGIDDFLWEIPAGKLDPGELPEQGAVRELAEETGITGKTWSSLGQYLPAPGYFSEIIHLYLARDLHIGTPTPDADEELEIQWLPFAEATNLVLQGDFNDGKTAMALWRTQRQLQL
jgi:8-oxo-dGTP pyrophosphatase MutT (NUDIX family)